MGAGAVKEATSCDEDSTHSLHQPEEMSCESCSVNFTIIKRRKPCSDCGKNHCSNCLSKQTIGTTTHRRCKRCLLLTSGNFTREDLMSVPTKDLRSFISRRKMPMSNCTEKTDLVDILLSSSNNSHYRREVAEQQRRLVELEERKRQRELESSQWGTAHHNSNEDPDAVSMTSLPDSNPQAVDPPTETVNTSEPSADESRSSSDTTRPGSTQDLSVPNESTHTAEAAADEPMSNQAAESAENSPREVHRRVTHLKDVKEVADIEDLTVRQLKEILATNYVVYKGCCEKWELIERVKRLWHDRQKNIEKVTDMESAGEAATVDAEAELCKICMDAVIDCVLLDCGHMVACTQCGKQMAECPMCRQYVVRVVHVFKA